MCCLAKDLLRAWRQRLGLQQFKLHHFSSAIELISTVYEARLAVWCGLHHLSRETCTRYYCLRAETCSSGRLSPGTPASRAPSHRIPHRTGWQPFPRLAFITQTGIDHAGTAHSGSHCPGWLAPHRLAVIGQAGSAQTGIAQRGKANDGKARTKRAAVASGQEHETGVGCERPWAPGGRVSVPRASGCSSKHTPLRFSRARQSLCAPGHHDSARMPTVWGRLCWDYREQQRRGCEAPNACLSQHLQ